METPITPELQRIIDATPCGGKTFLVTAYGWPFTANGFGSKVRNWCDAVGLPNCSIHGLRTAAAARLAELGRSEHEIMAITGHKTSKEVIHYTRAASQKIRAKNAMEGFAYGEPETKSVPLLHDDISGGTNLYPKPFKTNDIESIWCPGDARKNRCMTLHGERSLAYNPNG